MYVLVCGIRVCTRMLLLPFWCRQLRAASVGHLRQERQGLLHLSPSPAKRQQCSLSNSFPLDLGTLWRILTACYPPMCSQWSQLQLSCQNWCAHAHGLTAYVKRVVYDHASVGALHHRHHLHHPLVASSNLQTANPFLCLQAQRSVGHLEKGFQAVRGLLEQAGKRLVRRGSI